MYVNFWLGVACSVHRSLFIHNLLPSHLTSTLRTWEMFEGSYVPCAPSLWVWVYLDWFENPLIPFSDSCYQTRINMQDWVHLLKGEEMTPEWRIGYTRIAPREISRPVIYFIIQVNETLTWTFVPEILADWLGMSGLQTIWCQLVIQVIN